MKFFILTILSLNEKLYTKLLNIATNNLACEKPEQVIKIIKKQNIMVKKI